MLNKLLLLFIIIVFLTLLLSIAQSRKRLWAKGNKRNARIFTYRSIGIIVLILVFLFFLLFR